MQVGFKALSVAVMSLNNDSDWTREAGNKFHNMRKYRIVREKKVDSFKRCGDMQVESFWIYYKI